MRIESRSGALAVICLVFFGIGVPATVIGPALPELAAKTGSSLADLGALFTSLFLGALITQATSGFLIDRIGERPIVAVGIAVASLGILGMGLAPSLTVVLVGAWLLGAGNGAVLAAANVYIARIFGGRSLSALNVVNLFFGIGAVTGPALAGLAIQAWDSALPVIIAGGLFYLSLSPVILLLRVRVSEFANEGRAAANGSIYRAPLLWVMGGLLLLYVGTESGFGGWATTYIDRTTSLELGTAALVASGYWLALSLGRVAGAVLGRRLSPENLLLASLSGAVVGGILLAASTGNAALTVAATLLLGFSLGPVFPTVFALTTSTFSNAPGKAVSVILSMGSIGGMFLPWLQGSLMEGVSPGAMVMLVAGALLAMLGLYAVARVVAGRKPTVAARQLAPVNYEEG